MLAHVNNNFRIHRYPELELRTAGLKPTEIGHVAWVRLKFFRSLLNFRRFQGVLNINSGVHRSKLYSTYTQCALRSQEVPKRLF